MGQTHETSAQTKMPRFVSSRTWDVLFLWDTFQ